MRLHVQSSAFHGPDLDSGPPVADRCTIYYNNNMIIINHNIVFNIVPKFSVPLPQSGLYYYFVSHSFTRVFFEKFIKFHINYFFF